MKQNLFWYVLTAIVIIIADQITKFFAYQLEHAHNVTSWLSFDVAINRGISWGMFNGSSNSMFMIVTVVTSIITIGIVWYGYTQYIKGIFLWGYLFLASGAFSNIIDRFLYTGVIDFIHLHYAVYSWPFFNIADVFIVLGVMIIFIQHIKE